jgi:hypothetical protein
MIFSKKNTTYIQVLQIETLNITIKAIPFKAITGKLVPCDMKKNYFFKKNGQNVHSARLIGLDF